MKGLQNKKRFLGPIALAVLLLILSGCAGQTQGKQFKSFSDFDGTTIATHTSYLANAEEKMNQMASGIKFEALDDLGTLAQAVKSGRADAVYTDEPLALVMVNNTPELALFPQRISDEEYAFGMRKNEPLYAPVCRTMVELEEDGTMARLLDKWLNGPEEQKVLDELPFDSNAPVIKFGFDPVSEPMMYLANGKQAGYDVDLMRHIAYRMGYRLELVPVNMAARVEALQSGKIDVAGCCMTVTEERRKAVDFTQPVYVGGAVLVVLRTSIGLEATLDSVSSFSLQGIKNSFKRTFIEENRWEMILSGLQITVTISLSAMVLGTLLGTLLCAMRRTKRKSLRVISQVYVRLVQGIPTLVILMVLFYVVLAKTNVSGVVVAIIAFSMNFGAYTCEMFRTGIAAVDKGQREAAQAIGFGKLETFLRIILPQAAVHVLPVYSGEFVSMVKMTSVVGYIAVQDLTKVSDIIKSKTFEAFFPLISVAIIYFLLTYLVILLLTWIERRINPQTRKRVLKGVRL